MASYGPSDDFSNQPTRKANYGAAGSQPPGAPGLPEPPEFSEPEAEPPEPKPWYRKRAVIIAWAVMVVILTALVIYGIIQLITGGPGGPTPSKTTTTRPTTTTAPSTTATTTPTSTPTTTAPAPPPTSPAVQPPPGQQQPSEVVPKHPRWQDNIPKLPPLPSVITIPQVPTVITLPPGL